MLKDRLRVDDGKYDTPTARQTLYDHLPNLRKTATPAPVPSVQGLKFQNSLYGLYHSLGVDPKLWNVTALINKHDHNTSIRDLSDVMIPNKESVDRLLKAVKTSTNRALF